jgi:UDP-glucuronate 4-epimerase
MLCSRISKLFDDKATMIMNILITGAAGFIGSHLAERLAGLGHTVTGVDCFTDFYARDLKEGNALAIAQAGVALLPLDLSLDDLTSAVANEDVVYHLAAQPGLAAHSDFETYARHNIHATHRLIEACRRTGKVSAFVNVATSSVYGADATGDERSEPRPTSYYGVTKLAAEQLVMAHARDGSLPACSLRLFSVYGPRERPDKLYPKLIRALLEDEPFPLFEGSQHHLRSYTYVDDIIDGMVAVLGSFDRCLGQIINLGSDTAITTGEGIRIVEEIIGRSVKIMWQPRRSGDQLKTHAQIEKARRLLNYAPRTSPHDGLTNEVSWYRNLVHATSVG